MSFSLLVPVIVALVFSACTIGPSGSGSARKVASGGTSTATSTNTGTATNTNTSTMTSTATNTSTGPRNVAISWTANRESAVNRSGGGYRVYYSQTNGFAVSGASAVGVPYVSGASSPTSTVLVSLGSGTYYYKIVAYSAINPAGAESAQYSFTVP